MPLLCHSSEKQKISFDKSDINLKDFLECITYCFNAKTLATSVDGKVNQPDPYSPLLMMKYDLFVFQYEN